MRLYSNFIATDKGQTTASWMDGRKVSMDMQETVKAGGAMSDLIAFGVSCEILVSDRASKSIEKLDIVS